MLDAHPQARTDAADRDVTVGVGPVKIPAYLDRPEIVTRTGQSSLQFADFDRWAEPLEKNLTRVIVANLTVLLGTENVTAFPWPKSTQAKYQVLMEIIQMDSLPGGRIALDVRWSIVTDSSEKVLFMKRSNIDVPAPSPGYEGIAMAMSTAVEVLSHEIATTIRTLQSEQPAP
jgi:uncharacterized lipoprotein YmbA